MTRFLLLFTLVAGGCLAATAPTVAQEAPAPPSADEKFTPVTADDLLATKRELAERSAAIASATASLPDKGEGWRRYLKWDTIEPLSNPDAPIDVAALQATLMQLNSGAPGLELPVYREAAIVVRRLRDFGAIARSKDQRTTYNRQTQALKLLLDRDPHAVDPRVGYQLERRLDFLAGVERSPHLVAAVKDSFNHSNLLLTVSEPLLDRLVRRPVNSREPIRDNILGARIVGVGDTQAWLSVTTAPSDDSARLIFSLQGAIHSETTGYKGPFAVRSAADTPILAQKTVELTPESFLIMPASTSASTRSRTRSILKKGGGVVKGLLEKVASNRVEKDRSKADNIASRKAEARVATSFDDQVGDSVRDLRREFDNNWTKPLARYGAEPARFELKTTDNAFEAELMQADRGQLGADTPAPVAPVADAVARVHPSAVHNLGTALLGGATIRKDEADKPPTLSVTLPAWLDRLIPEETDPVLSDDAPPFRPWSLTLRAVRPLSAEVTDEGFKLHVHTAEIESGGNSYRGWDITLAYAPTLVDGRWRLERRGEIGVLPTSFDPKSGKRLKGRDVALRRNLAKALNEAAESGYGVPNFMELAPIDLSGFDQSNLRSLVVKNVDFVDGWLTIAWDAL